jgi:nicotinic acid mononucleotide adenylyltransferase
MSAAAGDSTFEKKSDTAFFTFGRFQPPTVGHRLLFTSLVKEAAGADVYVFVSSSQDKEKNPLTIDQKIHWLQKVNADLPVKFVNTTLHNCRTPVSAIHKLKDTGYKTIKMIVGSDRLSGFSRMVSQMKDLGGATVEVTTLGEERNLEEGISGTKMRAAALKGNLNSLSKGTGLNTSNATELMGQIKTGMGAAGGKRKSRAASRRRRKTRRLRRQHR